MNIKTTKTVEALFTVDDLKEILAEKLGKLTKEIYLKEITETESYPGADPHDAHYYDVFAGIKVTYIE